MDSGWAKLDTIGGKAVLRLERRLAHPPAKVFRAISDPEELRHWFPATVETDLRPGAPIRFAFADMDVDAPGGEIVELDPPRLLVYTWGEDVLRWEIVPEPGGCRLFFSHTLAGDGLSGGRLGAARIAAGWDGCVAALAARLDGEPAPAWDWLGRNEGYVQRFGLSAGTAATSGDGVTVSFARDAVQSAARVWALLTDGAEPAPGSAPPQRFTNRFVPAGAVTAVISGRVLEYEWHHDGAAAGRVRWELESRELGTVIHVVQTIPGGSPEAAATALAAWEIHLELLHAALNGAERCWPEGRVEALTARYAASLGAPGPPAARR